MVTVDLTTAAAAAIRNVRALGSKASLLSAAIGPIGQGARLYGGVFYRATPEVQSLRSVKNAPLLLRPHRRLGPLSRLHGPQPYLLLPSFLGGALGLLTSLANTDKSLPIAATRFQTRPRRTSWTYRNALFLESAKPYESRQKPLNLVGASSV